MKTFHFILVQCLNRSKVPCLASWKRSCDSVKCCTWKDALRSWLAGALTGCLRERCLLGLVVSTRTEATATPFIMLFSFRSSWTLCRIKPCSKAQFDYSYLILVLLRFYQVPHVQHSKGRSGSQASKRLACPEKWAEP